MKRLILVLLLLLAVLAGCAGNAEANEQKGSGTITSVSQLDEQGRKIGVVPGTKADVVVRERFKLAEIVQYKSVGEAFIAVKTGKIDAFCFTKSIMQYTVDQNPDLCLLDEPISANNLAIGAALGDSILIAEVNEAIKKINENGMRDEMEARWLGTDSTPDMPMIKPVENPSRTIVVGTCDSERPMSYLDADGIPVGFDVEYASRLARELGAGLEIQAMEWGALIPSLQSGKIDLIIANLNVTEERKLVMLFSDIYVSDDIVMMTRQPVSSHAITATDHFYQDFVAENRWKMIAEGLKTSMIITVFAFALATLLGLAVCYLRMSKNRIANAAGNLYVTVMRGTPVIVLLMITYYIIFAKSSISPVMVAVIAFGFNGAAFIGEVIRSAILTVAKGQVEAARSMGFSRIGAFFTVTFPQAARTALPVYKSEFISMFKLTSVVGYIAIMDLTKAGDIIRNRTYDAYFPLLAVAVVYLLVSTGMVWLFDAIDRRTNKRLRRAK